EADVIVFMVDGKTGVQSADIEVANLLRKTKKPVLLTVNKIDEPKELVNLAEFYELGIGEPQPLTALRGSGSVGDLLDKIVENFPDLRRTKKDRSGNGKRPRKGSSDHEFDVLPFEQELEKEGDQLTQEIDGAPLAIAIVGKPNVGKSS